VGLTGKKLPGGASCRFQIQTDLMTPSFEKLSPIGQAQKFVDL
jgi:hypothetical protein